ncbi:MULTISPECIES: hypothetical protein [unclassified Nocardioides]|uniref:hypothetical protein n=1 Tax=unclassified Nocardioides TaxID=2615069 RepID=UPI0006FF8BC0|nr:MULTISPECIES: hypothetical protein [unclassified Nocardioides]KRA38329.1 hypothetical protein ASD81_06740 [Nocardioides sp. Root614]KRA92288.1 hypothetical protein ASD84_07005 [Nocardioides sp. Root682]
MVHRITRVLALAVITAGVLVSAPFTSPPAHADGWGDACNPNTYGGARYRIVTATKAPAITHLSTYAIGPGVSRTITKAVSKQLVISAAVTYDSKVNVEASLPAKILVKAGAEVHLTLQASGNHTSTSNSSVTETVSNSTTRNVQYVFYKGVTKASGSFQKRTCSYYYFPGKNYGYYRIRVKDGKWRSYAIPGSGAVRCGAGTTGLGTLARSALRLGCPA